MEIARRTWLSKGKLILSLLGALLVLALPFVANNSILSLFVFVGLYTIIGVGLCLLLGYAGQISLGQAAFYGIGAYSTAILTTRFGINPWLAILCGVALSATIAYGVGRPLLKLQQHYLALATLGFGMIVHLKFIEERAITGGSQGISSIPRLALGSLVFDNDFKFYYLSIAVALAGILLARNIVNSRIGRALKAVHTSEVAASSLGVPVTNIKAQVFALSAAYASVAGSLFAHYITFIAPSTFGVMTSVEFVVMAAVGGLASIWGPIFGAATVIFLRRLLQTWVPVILPGATGEYEIVVFGIILVLIMIFMPEGLVAGTSSLLRKRFNQRKQVNSGDQEVRG